MQENKLHDIHSHEAIHAFMISNSLFSVLMRFFGREECGIDFEFGYELVLLFAVYY